MTITYTLDAGKHHYIVDGNQANDLLKLAAAKLERLPVSGDSFSIFGRKFNLVKIED